MKSKKLNPKILKGTIKANDDFDFKQGLTEELENEDISPLVKELIGIAKLPENFDVRNEYKKYLMKKYQ